MPFDAGRSLPEAPDVEPGGAAHIEREGVEVVSENRGYTCGRARLHKGVVE